jgi:hypothetical protein
MIRGAELDGRNKVVDLEPVGACSFGTARLPQVPASSAGDDLDESTSDFRSEREANGR